MWLCLKSKLTEIMKDVTDREKSFPTLNATFPLIDKKKKERASFRVLKRHLNFHIMINITTTAENAKCFHSCAWIM